MEKYNNEFHASVITDIQCKRNYSLLWFFRPFPICSDATNPQSSAFVGCYTFAGCGNGHSLSVMSETNSRVISLTSHRSRGVKLLRQGGCHCRADAQRHSCPWSSLGLGVRIGHVSKGENLWGECLARKGRLIAGRMYAALKQCRQVYGMTNHSYLPR